MLFLFIRKVISKLTYKENYPPLCSLLICGKVFEHLINNSLSEFFIEKEQENAMRCNNRDDLLELSFTLKISIFSEAYI